MKNSKRALAAVLALMLATLACSTLGNPADKNTPTETSEISGPEQTVAVIHEKQTRVAATDAAYELMSTALVETREAAATPTPDFFATQHAAGAAATAAAVNAMHSVVESIHEDGYLDQTSGTYYRLPDFSESWAQINWYQWWNTGHEPEDFVIRVDATWESASDSANFFTSGCGFVFRENGSENHYLVYLGMDGNAYFNRVYKGNWKNIGYTYYQYLDIPKDSGELMLAVEGSRITFYVNGELVESWRDEALTEGKLALTLLSGINTGYGTRCTMENVDLWVLE